MAAGGFGSSAAAAAAVVLVSTRHRRHHGATQQGAPAAVPASDRRCHGGYDAARSSAAYAGGRARSRPGPTVAPPAAAHAGCRLSAAAEGSSARANRDARGRQRLLRVSRQAEVARPRSLRCASSLCPVFSRGMPYSCSRRSALFLGRTFPSFLNRILIRSMRMLWHPIARRPLVSLRRLRFTPAADSREQGRAGAAVPPNLPGAIQECCPRSKAPSSQPGGWACGASRETMTRCRRLSTGRELAVAESGPERCSCGGQTCCWVSGREGGGRG